MFGLEKIEMKKRCLWAAGGAGSGGGMGLEAALGKKEEAHVGWWWCW